MVLFSFVGTLVFAHSLLLLIEKIWSKFNAAEWTGVNFLSLNIGVGVVTLVGLVIQGRIARWRDEREQRAAARAWSLLSNEEKQALQTLPKRRKIWNIGRR
jgi:hypothetical protein